MNRFSDEWWEHISLVNAVMLFKMNTEKWDAEKFEKEVKMAILDTHQHALSLEAKLDKIMSHLGIPTDETK